ncbi:flavodoxin domain-containing protein [Chloroflexota bacterium]
MKKVLVVFYSQSGNTGKMAQFVAEGVRISGHQAVIKSISDINSADDLNGYDGYIFGSPTHYTDVPEPMKTFLSSVREAKLDGKLGGAFGSYTHDGNAPLIISVILEQNFKMEPFDLGPFNLKDDVLDTGEGMRACHDYGRVFGEKLGQ